MRTITDWPVGLYNIQNIITAVNEKLKRTSNDYIMDALAKLYSYDKKYDKTLEIYLRLKRGNVFELIRQHSLFDAVQDKVLLLLEFDEQQAVQLLVSNTDRIPITQVVAQLQARPKLLHAYLHALFLKDAHLGSDFHELQVSLYAEYEPQLLLPFLRQSVHYPLEKAYQICEQRGLYKETVFILGRMGNSEQALTLIIEKIGDVPMAVEFVEFQKDEELWGVLINKCKENPKFIGELLEHIGAHMDPIKLIREIPSGKEIIGLRNRLVKIISDYNLQMSLREGCKEILKADCVNLFEKLYRGLRGGVNVDDNSARCASCGASVLAAKPESSVVIFFCSHIYHHRCLKSVNQSQQGGATQVPAYSNAPIPETTATGGPSFRASTGISADEALWCHICISLNSKSKGTKGRTLGQRKKV